MKFKYLFSLIIIIANITPQLANSSCSSELKMAIAERVAIREGQSAKLLNSANFKSWNQNRSTQIVESLKSIRPEIINLEFPFQERIKAFLKTKTNHPQYENTLAFITKFFEKGFIEDWSSELIQTVVTETYRSKNADLILKLETQGSLDKEIMIQVLQSRILPFDFKTAEDGKFLIVTQGLSAESFGKILSAKQPFIDRPFTGSSHGDFIHLWHVDMMIQALRSKNINPKEASKFYEWMGKNQPITLDNNLQLNSQDLWDPFFDSFGSSITTPEILNPILMNYFTWNL